MPTEFVTVNVYEVVLDGLIFTGVPRLTAPTPLLIVPFPPLNTAVSVVDAPDVMVEAPALKLAIRGAAGFEDCVTGEFCGDEAQLTAAMPAATASSN